MACTESDFKIDDPSQIDTNSPTGNDDNGGKNRTGEHEHVEEKKKQSRAEMLKKKIVLPEYLRKAMLAAIKSEGAPYIEGAPHNATEEAPAAPLIVFINSKSGGRLGPKLKDHLVELISKEQVFELTETKPPEVIRHGLQCLEKLANDGDDCARLSRQRLRILVAGGDGTVGWVLGSIAELGQQNHVPPVGVIPLGTGNDLARSFGWGKSFSSPSRSAIKKWLVKATDGSSMHLDSWQVTITAEPELEVKWPHSVKPLPQHHVPLPTDDKGTASKNAASFMGVFYNYFSIGMDAQVAYGFHELRNKKPWLARGPVSNKMIYSGYSCFQGWFCTSCSANPRARGVNNVLKLYMQSKNSTEWNEILIPSSVRAVVILNLQSYAGGRNPWGIPSAERKEKNGYVEAAPNDGVLEVFGLRDGWHTAFVMVSLLKAVRLGQAEALRLELHGERRSRTYMQMDGEPWQHPLNSSSDPTVVQINKVSTSSLMLIGK